MDILQDFFISLSWDVVVKTGLRILIVLFAAWFAVKLLHNFINRLEKRLLRKSLAEGEPATESEK